jgi:hypothetical protein
MCTSPMINHGDQLSCTRFLPIHLLHWGLSSKLLPMFLLGCSHIYEFSVFIIDSGYELFTRYRFCKYICPRFLFVLSSFIFLQCFSRSRNFDINKDNFFSFMNHVISKKCLLNLRPSVFSFIFFSLKFYRFRFNIVVYDWFWVDFCILYETGSKSFCFCFVFTYGCLIVPLLKRLVSPLHFYQKPVLHTYVSVFLNFSILFSFSTCLSSHQYHIVLITAAL